MTINKYFGFVYLLFSLSWSAFAKADPVCQAKEYAAVVAYAQGLDPLVEGLGRKMLSCSNRDYRESALYWLSFYYHMSDQRAKIAQLPGLLPRELLNSAKFIDQSAALNGNNRALTEAINSGESTYVEDPWLVMTLARTQMMKEQYQLAFANYSRVLKLRENQDSVEIELLFAYIWAKDKDAALAKIAVLRRYAPEPYIQQSIERAERLLGASEDAHPIQRDLLSLAYVQERDNRGYAARGGRAHYHGLVQVEIEALEHQLPIEEDKENVVSLTLGRDWGKGDAFQVLTELGYYSAGDQNLSGLLGARYHYVPSVTASVALRRKEVSAFERAPPGERAGLMRDSVLWSLGLYDRVFVSAALHSEDDALFEDYDGELRFGALLREETDSGFGLIIPLSYRHRPLASPDYRSFPHDIRLGLGLRLGISDGRKFLIRTEAVLESIHRDDYGAVDSYEQVLGGRIKAHARYSFQKSYYNFLEGSAYVIGKMVGESSDERGSEILLGLGLSQDSH